MSKRLSRILSFFVALAMLISPMAVLADDDPAILHGTVFLDEDVSGTLDVGEVGIEGVNVSLFDADGPTLIGEFLTGADGTYEFPDLESGEYIVEVEVSEDYVDTTPVGVPFNVDESTPIPTVNFGKFPVELSGSITGTVFDDLERDGVYDLGVDLPLEGVTVTLYASEGDPIAVDTDSSGEYEFTDLLPGVYTVVETDPEDYYSTTPNTVMVELSLSDSMDEIVDFGDFIPEEGEVSKIDLLLMKYFDIALLEFQDLRGMEGWGYGNIAKAYFLSQLSGEPVAGIIAMRDGMGWGNIMKSVLGRAGLKGYNLGLIVSGRETPQVIENLMSSCPLIENEEQAQDLFAMGASNGAIKKACQIAQEGDNTYETFVEALQLLKDYNQKQVREMLLDGATIQSENTERDSNHGPPACKGKNKHDEGCDN